MTTSRRRTPLALLLSTALLVTQTGCYTHTAIQPSELGKLQTGTSQVVGHIGNSTVVAFSTQTVTAADGTATQIKGEYDLKITLLDPARRSTTFKHPLVVQPNPPTGYTIQAGNQPQTAIDLSAVKRVEVVQYDATKTMVAIGVIGTLVPLIVLGAVIGSRN